MHKSTKPRIIREGLLKMSATTAPTLALNVSESASTEIKKFMAGEEGLPRPQGSV